MRSLKGGRKRRYPLPQGPGSAASTAWLSFPAIGRWGSGVRATVARRPPRRDVHRGRPVAQEVADHLSCERGEEHAVAAMPRRIPESPKIGIFAHDRGPVGGYGPKARPHPPHRECFEGRNQPNRGAEDLRQSLVRNPAVEPRVLHRTSQHGLLTTSKHVAM